MRFLTILSIAGILALVSCSTTRTIEQADRRVTNADVERMVKDKLAADPQLSTRKIDVAADADKNQVTLSGDVSTEQLRTRAVELAKASRTGLVIVDKIDVKPQEVSRAEYTEEMARTTRDKAREAGNKIGDSIEDAWIHTKITAKLIGDAATSARKINVDVMNNVVTLRGKVESLEAKTEAERIAKETEGVKRVHNLLKIVRPS
jgi:osmotically-inducible protein OsmY